jgi:hypothetical protein
MNMRHMLRAAALVLIAIGALVACAPELTA